MTIEERNKSTMSDEAMIVNEIKSDKDSMETLKNKAKQGDADAMFQLGLAYISKSKKDHDKAKKWVRKAAEHGQAEAQCCIGFACINGKEYVKGVEWLVKSANQGIQEASDTLETLCSNDDD